MTTSTVEVLRRARAAGVRIAYAADTTLTHLRVVRAPSTAPPES